MGNKIKFELRNDFIHILSLGLVQQYHRSENGRFIITWSDSYISDGKTIQGSFFLIDKDDVILTGETDRPHDGKVSNSGTFILNDWMTYDTLEGTFFAIAADGKLLIENKFNANLGYNGLSNDGNFAVCNTLTSENEDSNKMFFFDLIKKELKWSCMPESGNADSFRFDTEKRVLFLNYNGGKSCRYNFDGMIL